MVRGILVLLLLSQQVFAQNANYGVRPSATLYQVLDGVFRMEEGASVDLTDEHLLLTLVKGKADCIAVRLNSRTSCVENGTRIDLKNSANAPFYIRGMFEEKERCILDVFNLIDAKGQRASADFRLICA